MTRPDLLGEFWCAKYRCERRWALSQWLLDYQERVRIARARFDHDCNFSDFDGLRIEWAQLRSRLDKERHHDR